MNAFNSHLFRLFARYLPRNAALKAGPASVALGKKRPMVRGLFFTRARNVVIAMGLGAVLRRRHRPGRRAMVLHAGPRFLTEHLNSGDAA
jgi:hypothetical protein